MNIVFKYRPAYILKCVLLEALLTFKTQAQDCEGLMAQLKSENYGTTYRSYDS
jgi:hypothetical protein